MSIRKRDLERAKLHGPHGWKPRERQPLKPFLPGTLLVECPCGYLGWIDRRALRTLPSAKAAQGR